MPAIHESFEIFPALNEQTFGTLHLGRDRSTNAQVLLLVPREDLPPAEARRLLVRELTLGQTVVPPGAPGTTGVQKPLRYLEDASGGALVLGYFPGTSLRRQFQDRSPSLDVFFDLALHLCAGVDQVHRAGFVHRNLSLGSFLFDPGSRQTLLVDLALAVAADQETRHTSLDPVANWEFLAPEQTGRLGQAVDYRSDYYSLGMVLYALAAGRSAFSGLGRLELIHGHLAKVPARPPVPGALADVILKLLEKTPERRYQSMTGLIADLVRCRDLWAQSGAIPAFALGSEDNADRFQVSQHLFGREKEREVLRAAYLSASGGTRERVLIKGPSGVGKSTLVQEIGPWVLQGQGVFLQGKYDESQADQPYLGIRECIRDLVQQIGRKKDRNRWAQAFAGELKSQLAVLSSLVPEFEEVVGPQPPPAPLAPQETETRFLMALAAFLRVLQAQSPPAILFLDDVQWIDPASVRLLNYLITQNDQTRLMVVYAFRPTEPAPNLEFYRQVETGATRPVLDLRPLDEGEVTALVSRTLGTTVRPLGPLGALLHQKTGGNHFFVVQLLRKIHQDGLLFYRREARAWDWDPAALEALSLSENVFDLLIANFKTLPEASQRCLALAAGLGMTFEAGDLRRFPAEVPDLGEALAPLVDHHYLVPLSDDYLPLRTSGDQGPAAGAPPMRFRFQHDKVRQSAFALMDGQAREEFHLKLGRALWEDLKATGNRDRLGEAVGHFLPVLGRITDPAEKTALARLLLMAGEQARARSARDQAMAFFRQAKDLADGGAPDPALAREILFRLAELCYLSRQTDEAEALCGALTGLTEDPLEKAEVSIMQIDSYAFLGETQTAIDRGLRALEALGCPVSAAPHPLVLARELILVTGRASRVTMEELFRRQGTTPPRIQMLLRLLGALQVPANLSRNNNFPVLLILKATGLALGHGNNPETAQAFAHFSILLSAMGKPRRAFEFGSLAVRLGEAFPNPKSQAHNHNVFTLYCLPWNRPWAEHAPAARKSAELALQNGDLFTLAFETNFSSQFAPHLTLAQSLEAAEKTLQTVANTGLKDALAGEKMVVQRWRNLAGEIPEPGRVTDARFDYQQVLDDWTAQNYTTGIAVGHLGLLSLNVLLGRTAEAAAVYPTVEKHIPALVGSAFTAEYSLFSFLFQADRASDPKLRSAALKKMVQEHRRVGVWTETCPENFAHWQALMEAEILRVRGRRPQAARAYDRALALADRQPGLRDKGLVHERAGAFHLTGPHPKMGAYLLREAHQWYGIWGAVQKTAQLERAYPDLALHLGSGASRTAGDLAQNSDTASIVKVTQAISREMDLDRLLKTVVLAVVESAGAERGWLLLPDPRPGRERSWEIAVRGDASGQSEVRSAPLEDEGISGALVARALGDPEGLLVADASADPQFSADPQVAARGLRSLLCQPFGVPGGPVTGIWYLENNLLPGAFTFGRREALKPLSGQIAISLENARNYRALRLLNRTLEQKVEERTAELDERNRQFLSSVEYAAVLQRSLLPPDFGSSVEDSFALFRPRDPVGGDLYWFQEKDGESLLVLVDCTGHGVPGALITVIVHSLLTSLVREVPLGDLKTLVRTLNYRFRRALGQHREGSTANDGFDIGVCWWSPARGLMRFLGAHIGLYIRRPDGVVLVPGERYGLGYPKTGDEVDLPVHEQALDPGAAYLMTTDGFISQIGGPHSIALGRDRFSNLVQRLAGVPLGGMGRPLEDFFREYRGPHPQLDDVTLVGWKVRGPRP